MCGICFYLSYKEEKCDSTNHFELIKHRGPDKTIKLLPKFDDLNIVLMFHRLAINDVSDNGNQPFIYKNEDRQIILMCNGEIYNYKKLFKDHLQDMIINGQIKGSHRQISNSDCEVIIPLYLKYGINKTVDLISNNEFAFILLDINKTTLSFHCSRDVAGIRPMFYYKSTSSVSSKSLLVSSKNHSQNHSQNYSLSFGFCSELKGLLYQKEKINIFPPGNILTTDIYYNEKKEMKMMTTITPYYNYLYKTINYSTIEIICEKIRTSLIESVNEKLISDRPIGCLLSGGLDSSLITSIASFLLKNQNKDKHLIQDKSYRLRTYTIGMEKGTDIKYAEMVAKYIDSNHTTFYIKEEEALQVIPKVIKAIETYDITTIRASIFQYLLAERIAKNTDTKVILNGDGSDEITMGYLYFHNVPNPEEGQKETVRLLKEIHKYDVLRVDRTISNFGIESRVPFLSKNFIDTYMNIDPKLKIPYILGGKKIEKYLLRKSFEDMKLLPTEVLWRRKEALSDGVSGERSWFQILQEYIDKLITDKEYKENKDKYVHNTPISKESYYYRKLFEEYFPNSEHIINNMWLPKWSDSNDPSARTLTLY